MKKETLEEAANSIYPNDGYEDEMYCDLGEFKRDFFIEGIKSDIARDYWYEKFQQEQDKKMYSEEELEKISKELFFTMANCDKNIIHKESDFEKWFEKFKKK